MPSPSSGVARNATSPSVVAIGNDKTITVNGNPFFPLGIYIDLNGSLEEQTVELLAAAAAGFNTIHTNVGGMGLPNFLTFLDTANSLGVMVIAEFDLTRIPTYVGQLKTKPAILAYDIADDVDDGSHSKAEIAQLYQQVKATDPNHLAYIAAGHYTTQSAPNVGTFVTTTDIIGFETYPIEGEPLYITAFAIANARDAGIPYGRPVVAINQAFGYAGYRTPTPAEERVMTYQSLTMGAKGIVYYSYHDPAPMPDIAPALWAEVNTLAREIGQLAPVLQNGQRFDLLNQFNNGADFAAYWRYNGQVYVAISNSSSSGTNTESLNLPADVVGPARPLFGRYAASMSFANGKLSGSIGPQGVQVYVLDTGSVAPVSTGVGSYRPASGQWYLRDSVSTGAPTAIFGFGGLSGDITLMCDWTGDGSKYPVIFRNGVWYFGTDANAPAVGLVSGFGSPGDKPVCGDWTGKGRQTIGVFRNSVWYLSDSNSAPRADHIAAFGSSGDKPVVGDWIGQGRQTIGIFRNGVFYLSDSNTAVSSHHTFAFGTAGDKPVVGEWIGIGREGVGVVRNGVWYLSDSVTAPAVNHLFAYGGAGDQPVVYK